MSPILRATAMIVSTCAAAAGALKEAWAASAMGANSLKYRPGPEMVCKACTDFHAEFRALVIETFQFWCGGEAPETDPVVLPVLC
jgi:hypothetical protein